MSILITTIVILVCIVYLLAYSSKIADEKYEEVYAVYLKTKSHSDIKYDNN